MASSNRLRSGFDDDYHLSRSRSLPFRITGDDKSMAFDSSHELGIFGVRTGVDGCLTARRTNCPLSLQAGCSLGIERPDTHHSDSQYSPSCRPKISQGNYCQTILRSHVVDQCRKLEDYDFKSYNRHHVYIYRPGLRSRDCLLTQFHFLCWKLRTGRE